MKILKVFEGVGNKQHRIVRYPNRKYYNHYDIIRGNDRYYSIAGGFSTVVEAYKRLKKHREIKRRN